MHIYKIFRADEWSELKVNGESDGAPIDIADGYIHFSTAETVKATAEKYFSDKDNLVLCALEANDLSPLKWEPAREGVLFPHLYRKIKLSDIIWDKPLMLIGGSHKFPDLS